MAYSHKNGYQLNFTPKTITIKGKHDNLSGTLRDILLSQQLTPAQIDILHNLYKRLIQDYPDPFSTQYNDWYWRLISSFSHNCVTITSGSTINPPAAIVKTIHWFLNKIACKSIYIPYSGIGNVSRTYFRVGPISSINNKYTNQEPSVLLSTISRLLTDDSQKDNITTSTGNFQTDWRGAGHHAIVCFPPLEYDTYGEKGILKKRGRSLKIQSRLFHMILNEKDLETAIVFVNDDFLSSPSEPQIRVRKHICPYITHVIPFTSNTFTDCGCNGAMLVLNLTKESGSIKFGDFLNSYKNGYDETNRRALTVDKQLVSDNCYCLERRMYETDKSVIQRITGPDGKYGSDNINYVPLREIACICPENYECDAFETYICDGKYLQVSLDGTVALSENGEVCWDDFALKLDESKVSAEYLGIVLSSDTAFKSFCGKLFDLHSNDIFVDDYLLNWRIPMVSADVSVRRT